MRSLLDVNVLIALFDAEHVFNERAHDWLAANAADGIATCPLTENGLVRILSNPGYSKVLQITPALVIERLANFVRHQNHEFWPDSLSLRHGKNFNPRAILGSKQLTDIYLLGLAVKHKGRLVTTDENVPLLAVADSRSEHLVVI